MSKAAKLKVDNTKPQAAREEAPAATPITKPKAFSLDKFKVKRTPTIDGVDPLQQSLVVMRISDANDFVRLHPDEENYWTPPICLVSVPVKGQKKETLHLIDEDIAVANLPSKKIKRFRLALASKPFDVFFLCLIPCVNLDNKFNETAVRGCDQAKTVWVEVSSRKDQGHDDYQIKPARNPKAFPEPKWPTQPFDELIGASFDGRQIETEDHPGLLRLIGDAQRLG